MAQPHSTAFGGVFPNITGAILDDENSTKYQNVPPKIYEFVLTRISSPKNGSLRAFFAKYPSRWYALLLL